MSKNWHREVIDVLAWAEHQIDATHRVKLLREIAKSHPAVLVRTANANGYQEVPSLEKRVREMMKQEGMKIEAIKLVRNERGIGLKEAKDFVEALA